MKLFKFSIFLSIILCFGFVKTYAYDLSNAEKQIFNGIMEAYAEKQSNLDENTKNKNYKQLFNMLSVIEKKYSNDQKNQVIIGYFKKVVSAQMGEDILEKETIIENQAIIENTVKPKNIESEFKIDYGKYNVDLEKVRNARLSWHNTERSTKGKKNYVYNLELERTAYTRAKFLGDNFWTNLNSKTRKYTSHRRKPGDEKFSRDYNTDSIKEWFSEQGVNFKGNGTLFTENIGRGYFSCKKSDCTDDIIKSIKSTWNMFMSEKKTNGSHYRGIMSSNYKNMGVGVYVFGNRYVVVTHYGMDIE